jgi:predicted transcriptional regulator of viral defense system
VAEKVNKLRLDSQLADLAARQHAVVTRAQLLGIGFSDDAIASRVRAGWLVRVHPGVLAVGRQPLTLPGRFLAAVFSAGEGAVLSHLGAAVLWNLLPERGPRVDVTVPGGARKGGRTVIVHRSPLGEHEVSTMDGIPVTTPARTVLDLAAVVSRRELERAMDEAAYLRLDLSGLEPQQGRRGSAAISRVLAEHQAGTTLTRSRMEELMLALCDRFELPRPLCNFEVEGYTVDFVWPQARLIVETDGWRAHGTRRAFETDRRRDAHLIAVGWRPMRLTWNRLTKEPLEVAGQLKELLS